MHACTRAKVVPMLNEHHAMKTYPVLNYTLHHEDICKGGGIAPHILNMMLDGGKWSVSCPSCFTPRNI